MIWSGLAFIWMRANGFFTDVDSDVSPGQDLVVLSDRRRAPRGSCLHFSIDLAMTLDEHPLNSRSTHRLALVTANLLFNWVAIPSRSSASHLVVCRPSPAKTGEA